MTTAELEPPITAQAVPGWSARLVNPTRWAVEGTSKTTGEGDWPWLPATLGGLVVHLDVEDLTPGEVALWPDRTANGYDFAEFPNQPPELVADALGTGLDGVEFRWHTDYDTYDGEGMRSTAAGLLGMFNTIANPWTVHIVCTLDSLTADANSNDYYVLFTGHNANLSAYLPEIYYGWQGDDTSWDYMAVYRRAVGQTSKSWSVDGPQYPDAAMTGTHLLTFRWTGTALSVYVDGVLVTPDTNDYGTTPLDVACTMVELGEHYNSNYPANPQWAESPMATYGAVYIQDEAISAEDLASLVAYATDRWTI